MQEITTALDLPCEFNTHGSDFLPSRFAVTDLATYSMASVGCAIASLSNQLGLVTSSPTVAVDRRLASLWFRNSIQPIDWQLPPGWDAIAGDYKTSDGWIRLHTNLPHHRAAALAVLEEEADKAKVTRAVASWEKNNLESAIVNAGGAAAAMRTRNEWEMHPQGLAVKSEPLITWTEKTHTRISDWPATLEQPLAGLKVLDMTRVLAGPIATRALAGFGATVLRIDSPDWDEPNVVPDITLGKKCARLDLKSATARLEFEKLLSQADILVHGYRPGALDGLGYSRPKRQQLSPALIEVSLDAYGWTGPWGQRRGFDSLVQMSCGIADAGMHWASQDKPTPLPVQALDHATGYLMAAAAIRAVHNAVAGNGSRNAQLSLARTAELLVSNLQNRPDAVSFDFTDKDFSPAVEQTPWGQANRLMPAITIAGIPMMWKLPACELGSSVAEW